MFKKGGGLVPAVVQDDRTGDVLMLGFMNEEALAETRRTREVVFFSRSRNRLWKKGESSGHAERSTQQSSTVIPASLMPSHGPNAHCCQFLGKA